MNISVIGASNIDIHAQSKDKLILHDSNMGTHSISFGGVGRNIMLNLSVLGHNVSFFTNRSYDALGQSMFKDSRKYAKVYTKKTTHMNLYLSIFDQDKDLHVAIASMRDVLMDVSVLERHVKKIIKSDIIVTETNMSLEVLSYISKLQHPFKVIELVSITKASKVKAYVDGFHYIKGNQEEIKELYDTIDPKIIQTSINHHQHVIMTSKADLVYDITQKGITSFKPEKIEIIHTSGAGDGFLSGYLDGIKHDPLKRGFEVATYVLQSHESTMKGYEYDKNSRSYKKSIR